MKADKLEYFKKLLLEKRKEVHERIEHLREVAMESPAATGPAGQRPGGREGRGSDRARSARAAGRGAG